jgi:hypothetical protein
MSFSSELSIITPVSRPQLLPRVALSIPEEAEWILVTDGPLEVPHGLRPHIMIEGPKTGQWGDVQRQIGLGESTKPFVYFLDDDNLMLPTLAELVIPYLGESGYTGVLFGLLVHTPKGLRIWPAPPAVEAGRVDTAMFLGRRDAVQGLRFGRLGRGRGWPDLQGLRFADFIFLKAFEQKFGLSLLPAVYGFHNGLSLLESFEALMLPWQGSDRLDPKELISVIHRSLFQLVEHPLW